MKRVKNQGKRQRRRDGSVGGVGLVTEMAVNLTGVAAQMSLVVIARSGGDVVPLFRFWDTLYNSGAYALEAGWVAAFGLAMRDAVAFPRWLTAYSVVTAALLALNVFAIWVGIPDTATLPSALFLMIWFVSTSYGLSRGARRATRMAPGLAIDAMATS